MSWCPSAVIPWPSKFEPIALPRQVESQFLTITAGSDISPHNGYVMVPFLCLYLSASLVFLRLSGQGSAPGHVALPMV